MATSISPPTMQAQKAPGPDRFLAAILLGLVALLLVAGGAFILARQAVPPLPADTPGGTVQRFYQALDHQNYDAAYDLLSDALKDKPTREAFTTYYLTEQNYQRSQQGDRLRITEERGRGEVAFVTVEITHYSNNPGPFGNAGQWSETETFTLRHEPGIWRISDLPYGYRPYTTP